MFVVHLIIATLSLIIAVSITIIRVNDTRFTTLMMQSAHLTKSIDGLGMAMNGAFMAVVPRLWTRTWVVFHRTDSGKMILCNWLYIVVDERLETGIEVTVSMLSKAEFVLEKLRSDGEWEKHV